MNLLYSIILPFAPILPGRLKSHFRLEPLREDEAILAIKGPLTNIISSYSEEERRLIEGELKELVKELLKITEEDTDGRGVQLEGEFIEPIQLQVVCQRWWNERVKSESLAKKANFGELALLPSVDGALQEFYEEAIHHASKQTGIKEEDIRRWCQEKLITSSGTRSIIHRDFDHTGGISNKVVDILESKYLIRREWRSGASWYELTHDRLIMPITNSNTKWKYINERKKRRLILKVAIPSIAISVIVISALLFVYIINPAHHAVVQQPTKIGDAHDRLMKPIANKEWRNVREPQVI